MAVVETSDISNNFLMLTPDGSSDWDCATNHSKGLRVWSILFYPSAANDVICLKADNDLGPIIFKAKDVDGRGLLINLPGNIIFPYLDQSECTFSNAANARISFCLV